MSALSPAALPAPRHEEIFGIDFWTGTSAEAVGAVGNWLAGGYYFTLSFANPEFILTAEKDPQLTRYLLGCRGVFADGAGIVLASRLQGGHVAERITGTDFQWEIFRMAAERGLRVFLYGGKPGVAERAAAIIAARLPALTGLGFCNGYLAEADVLAQIAAFRPDIVVVCLGNPAQEHWIARHGSGLGARLVFGNGGALDFIAGQVRRAPRWMCEAGFEWLWRLLQDPSWTRIRRQARLLRYVGKLVKLKYAAR